MIRSILILCFLALSACGFTPEGSLVRDTVKTKGAQAYDEGLENAEWFICNAASIGSIRRKYGRDPKSAQVYTDLCSGTVPAAVIEVK